VVVGIGHAGIMGKKLFMNTLHKSKQDMHSPSKVVRVMFIVSGLYPGGMEGRLVDLLNSLDSHVFAPTLCVLHDGTLLTSVKPQIPVFSKLLGWAGDPRVLLKLVKLLKIEAPTIVVTKAREDAAFWGRLAARIARVPIIIETLHHGYYRALADPKRVLYHQINRLADPWTDAFVAISHVQRDFYISIGLPKKKITVIYNGIDISQFNSGDEAQSSARRRLDLPAGAQIIGMTANFSTNKNHALLLQALSEIRRTLPGICCLLIGDGPTRPQVERLGHKMGLTSALYFLGTRIDVPNIIPALDVFVLTSNSESFSNVIIEAMACGKPVVATDSGGPREIVIDGETGYLVPTGDALALAEKIILLLREQALARKLGQSGRSRVMEKFSIPTMVSAFETLLLRYQ